MDEADAKGRFQELEVETCLKGPRAFEPSGPRCTHKQTSSRTVLYRHADPDILHDEITTIDKALAALVNKKYHREASRFTEAICPEGNPTSRSARRTMLSADGLLMPAKSDCAAGSRYFKQRRRSDACSSRSGPATVIPEGERSEPRRMNGPIGRVALRGRRHSAGTSG